MADPLGAVPVSVVAAAQPVAETFATNGPSLSVAVYYQISECGPTGSVEYLLTERHVLEHIRQPEANTQLPAPRTPDTEALGEAAACTAGSGSHPVSPLVRAWS